jgi:steroid 5-alpha reductase family enzyme
VTLGLTLAPGLAVAAAAAFLFLAKTAAWLIQRRHGNAGIVDGIWAWALGALATWFALVGTGDQQARLAMGLMGGLWGLRLGTYLWRRNWRQPEDWRYAEFRAEWGRHAPLKMFGLYQFQNLFTLALACCAFLPVAYQDRAPAPWAIGAAMTLWLIAVLGEASADRQLQAFKARQVGHDQFCQTGWWHYSRHPNYFFECLHWAAYVPLTLGGPWVGASIMAPLIMALLVLKISGVPLLERRLLQTRPGYAQYMRRTSRLLPWWPRP